MRNLIMVIFLALVFNCVFVFATWPMGSLPSLGSHEFAKLVFALRPAVNWLLALSFAVLLIMTVKKEKRLRKIAHPLLTLALLVCLAIGYLFDAGRIFLALDGPTMAAADSAALPGDLQLVHITRDGASHAYPVQYLAYHHLVRDTVGDQELDITYCVMVDTVSAFVRDPDTSLELVAARSNNSIYRDAESGSWWQQQTGRSVAGERKGDVMETVETERLTFSEWRKKYPQGRIMQPEPKFEALYAKFFPALWPD